MPEDAKTTLRPTHRWAPWKIVLTVVALTVIAFVVLVAAIVALAWKDIKAPYRADIRVIDLAQNASIPPDAYLVVVAGEAQPAQTIVIRRTFNGDNTDTAYIPLTAPGWTPQQPVRVLRKERLDPRSPQPFGPGESRQVRTETLTLRRDAIPGIVRAGFEREHIRLAPHAVLVVGRFDDN